MIRKSLLSVALVAGLAFPLAAQEPERRRARAGPLPPGPGPANEAFKVVDAYVLSNLQESLGLTDEQFVKLLPLVKRAQSDRREFAQRRARNLMEMRQALASGATTESRVLELLKELKAVESEEPQLMRKDLDAIDAALSPLQQAKFRVLLADVEQRIRELLRQMSGPRGPGRAQQPENPPPQEREPDEP